MRDTFQQLKASRAFTTFEISTLTDMRSTDAPQVVLAARELKQTDLPNNSWESEHIAFTHGYGIATLSAHRCKRPTGLRISGYPRRCPPQPQALTLTFLVYTSVKDWTHMPLLAPHVMRSTFKITMIGPKSPAMTELTESTSIRCLSSRLLSVSLNPTLWSPANLAQTAEFSTSETYWTEPNFSPHSSRLTGTLTCH